MARVSAKNTSILRSNHSNAKPLACEVSSLRNASPNLAILTTCEITTDLSFLRVPRVRHLDKRSSTDDFGHMPKSPCGCNATRALSQTVKYDFFLSSYSLP